MKIRIKGNSLRYRLSRTDVETLATQGKVTEQTNFGPSRLQYQLVSTTENQLSATFENNCISIYFPGAWINDWTGTNKTGFDEAVDLPGTTQKLYLLVEKDFTCLDNVTEDQSDNYPNPLLNKTS